MDGIVTLGTGAFLGTGGVIIPNISVGEWTIIGAGSEVIRSLPAHVKAVGVPARLMENSPKDLDI